ncbi:MAG: Vms1/Ankzf1 family peptidyl-tRNA hydrolase [Vicinamibacteraceae bacterium]
MPLTGTRDVDALLDRLSRFEPCDAPVLSLYLNAQPDEHGRDHFNAFVKKELQERVVQFQASREVRDRLEADAKRIEYFLHEELDPSANGVALFACGADLFETLQTQAPFDTHALYLTATPHLYPLARLSEKYPRYAVLLTDTNTARIVVVALNRCIDEQVVESPKTARTSGSGWSQTRYQRHVDHERLHHVKDVVERLELIARADKIDKIVLAGEERVLPMVRDRLPSSLAALVVDRLRLDVDTPEREVLERTLDAIHQRHVRTDQEIVEHTFDNYRAGGLAVVGLQPTRRALERGQVHVLLLSAQPQSTGNGSSSTQGESGPGVLSGDVADELLRRAHQTDAQVRLIEDPELLRKAGGVAAQLRFRL